MKYQTLTVAALSWVSSVAQQAATKSNKVKGFIPKSRVPDTGRDSITLPNGIEFQPAQDSSNPKMDAAVRQAQGRMLGEAGAYESQFLDGTETFYDDYSQAWRLLGFYIDCNADGDGVDNYRRLSEEDEDDDRYCQRFLLWAAVSDGTALVTFTEY